MHIASSYELTYAPSFQPTRLLFNLRAFYLVLSEGDLCSPRMHMHSIEGGWVTLHYTLAGLTPAPLPLILLHPHEYTMAIGALTRLRRRGSSTTMLLRALRRRFC